MLKKFLKIFFLSLLGLPVLIIIIFNKNIPAFIYNEFEWREKICYLAIEEVMTDISQLVDIRTGKSDLFLSDQDKMYKTKDVIDNDLEIIEKILDRFSLFIQRQDKIPFLPSKYKKYQEMKKIAFDNYRNGLLTFKRVKTIEHAGFDLAVQADILNKRMSERKNVSDEEYWKSLKENADIAKEMIEMAKKLYDDKYIDEGYKNYFVIYFQKVIDTYNLFNDPEKTKNMQVFNRELEKISQRGTELDINQITTNWHKNIIDDLNKKADESNKLFYQQMAEADKHYNDNNLGKDLISRFLSIFSKKYPKNI